LYAAFQPRWALLVILAGILGGLITVAHRSRKPPPQASDSQELGAAPVANRWNEEFFNYAIDNLNRLEEFDAAAMLQQIIDRLNGWLQAQEFPADWKPDAMITMLPEPLLMLPAVRDLDRLSFSYDDSAALEEACWTRDIAAWARGKQQDDVSRAEHLFDWTTRNIQLETAHGSQNGPAGRHVAQTPVETLLLGQGTVLERAWVFILLARQQGLEAALLAIPEAKPSDKDGAAAGKKKSKSPEKERDPERAAEKRSGAAEEPRPWAVAVRSGQQLYLFDPRLGLPIPAPGPIPHGAAGQLEIRPATLAEAATNVDVLRRLDVDSSRRYPVRAEEIRQVVALLEASPSYLSRRMKVVESRLVGKQKAVLSTSPSAQADCWRAYPHIAEVRLWKLPYETALAQSRLTPEERQQKMLLLWPVLTALAKARLLHFKGAFAGEQSATHYYLAARPSNADLSAAEMNGFARAICIRAKQNASYWLGLAAFERGKYPDAVDYFAQRTLEASPAGPWTAGAKYNLGRTYEASGQIDAAIAQYRSDDKVPADRGSLLRAKWLEESTQGK
jgi:hypothetical protein